MSRLRSGDYFNVQSFICMMLFSSMIEKAHDYVAEQITMKPERHCLEPSPTGAIPRVHHRFSKQLDRASAFVLSSEALALRS